MKTINTSERTAYGNGKRLLSKKEAMEYLGITYDMVNALIRQEGFPVVRLGRPNSKRPRVFIDMDQLDQWIRDHTGYNCQ